MAKGKATSTFKSGDIVKLKSGSPNMTVKDVSSYDGNVHCQWFAGAKLSSGKFDPESLEHVKEEE